MEVGVIYRPRSSLRSWETSDELDKRFIHSKTVKNLIGFTLGGEGKIWLQVIMAAGI